jgi:NleD-like pathogen effector protein (putative zinc metallopeptidase)
MRRARLTLSRAGTTIALLAAVVALGVPTPASAHVVIQGDAGFVAKVEECLDKIAASGGQAGTNLTNLINNPNNVHTITQGTGFSSSTPSNGANAQNGTGTGSTISWDPSFTGNFTGDTTKRDPCAALAHEMSHSSDFNSGTDNDTTGPNDIPNVEIKACGVENEYRANQKPPLPKRNKWGGKDLP